MSALIAKI